MVSFASRACGARAALVRSPRVVAAWFSLLTIGLWLACPAIGHAQTQRGFVNQGFELPAMGANCNAQIADSTVAGGVPGWVTTNPSGAGYGCGSVAALTGPLVELWSTAFLGVTARQGSQFAELNATTASRLYQNVCLNTGETIGWQFSHRGRQSATTADIAQLRIGSTTGSNRVVNASDTSNGGLGTNNGYNCYANDGSVTANTCTRNGAVANGWSDYTGSFTWGGTAGMYAIGFEAISSAGGNTSIGNFLDNIQVTLSPYVEFVSATYSTIEGGTFTPPQINVIGTVPSGGMTVNIALTGTAVVGTDYSDAGNTTTVAVNVPAGVYATATPFSVPISIVNNLIIQDNRTLVMTISPSASYFVASTQSCGGTPTMPSTLTIIDNDIDLKTTKTQSTATPVAGTTMTYTVTYTNNTAKPTVAPTNAHDATAAIADAVPSGITAFSAWTCSASGGASCPGGAVNATVSGSGAISGSAFLPAGNAGAGGSVTYTITATVPTTACSGSIINTSTITTPSGFDQGTSVGTGFVSPASGGAADLTASATANPVCKVNVSVAKSDASTSYSPGGSATYSITVSNSGPSQAGGVTVSDLLPKGLTIAAPGISCAGSGGATCSGSGSAVGTAGTAALNVLSGYTLTLPPGSSLVISMPITFSANVGNY